jgi:membrane-associated phospholipid phosphatase
VTSDPIVAIDHRLAALLAAYREPALTKVFLWLTLLGKGQVVAAAATAACALFLVWQRRYLLVPLLIVLAGTQATVQAVKHLVLRARPGAELAYYVEKSSAFPSGHAAMATALYGFLVYALARDAASWTQRANIAFAGLAMVLAVGLSRLYLGVHFPSDVLGGYVVGLLWLVIGISLAELLRAKSPQPLPSPSPLPVPRVALTTVLVALATAFYVIMALHYAPPLANVDAPASSPAIAE